MKKSYKQLIADIQRLSATANKIRKAEVTRATKAFKKKLAEYQLTLHDLGAAGAAAYAGARDGMSKSLAHSSLLTKAPAKKKKDRRSIVKPKYRHPKTKETWSGRGKTPRWLAKEIANGKKRESFLIK
jgi:DNA-binding protein H-NS